MPRIVIATDFSKTSRVGFDAGVRLALDLGADVVLVHAMPGPGPAHGIAGGRVQRDIRAHVAELETDDVVTLTQEWAEQARAQGVTVHTVAEEASPPELILRAADEYDASIIVVGSHGRGGLGRLVAGSVAEAVLRKSTLPVLVVPVR